VSHMVKRLIRVTKPMTLVEKCELYYIFNKENTKYHIPKVGHESYETLKVDDVVYETYLEEEN
jgi:hypothetical protein